MLTLTLAVLAAAANPAPAQSQGPTVVSLRVRDVPATEAYAELARQAGVKIDFPLQAPPGGRVTANLIHEPFWVAVRHLGRQTRLEVVNVRREPMQVVSLGRRNRSGSYTVASASDGPFYASLDESASDRDFTRPADPTTTFPASLNLRLRAEPKLRPLVWESVKVEEFTDEYGRAIEYDQHVISPLFQHGSTVTILKVPPRPWPRKIGRLRVTGKVLAALSTDVVEITRLSTVAPPHVTAGGFDIRTDSRPGKRGRVIVMEMIRNAGDGPDWLRAKTRLGVFQPEIFDAQGRRLNTVFTDRDWFGRSCRLQIEARPPNPDPMLFGEAERLVMEMPAEVVEYDVRLEFTDVTLH